MKRMFRLIRLTGLLLLAGASAAWASVVNLNTAGAEELAAAISGVGVARAQAIIDYRDEYGPFRTVDDIVLVNGIGPSILEKNRAVLSVGEADAN